MSVTFLKTNNRGITIMETILYMVILTFVMSIIVQMLISISGMYRTMKVTRELESSGTIAMERILREIRNASAVVVGESDFGTNPGELTISGTDESLNLYKIKFDVSSGILQITKDSEEPVALTSSSGVVSYLLFTHLATSTSEAIKVELEMSGNSGSVPKSEKFYGFAILRGSY
jgi:hypothetical protein